MKAVCPGDETCKFSSQDCLVTPLSTQCMAPLYPLSKKVCNGRAPKDCPVLQGVFSHMEGLSGGECGVVEDKWCFRGKTTTVTSARQYYAYCAAEKGQLLLHTQKQNFALEVKKQSNQCLLPFSTLEDDWRKTDESNMAAAPTCSDCEYLQPFVLLLRFVHCRF